MQPQLINISFINNTSVARGGAVANDYGAKPLLINCLFNGNKSLDKGGAIYNDFGASPLIINTIIRNNSSISAAGIGNDGGASPLLINVMVSENNASSKMGSGLYQGTGANNFPVVINSEIDDIYNWHEDTVAILNTKAPTGKTTPLKAFIEYTNLKEIITQKDITDFTNYTSELPIPFSFSLLEESNLLSKLVAFYQKSSGYVNNQNDYAGLIYTTNEYVRPTLSYIKTKQAIFYVDATSAASLQDGSSWKHAYRDLQQAIDHASLNHGEIWVKAGSYHPQKMGNKIAAFILYDNIKIYGGFSGKESTLLERQLSKNQTILSAKLADGSYSYPHVMLGANNVVLDGLTIKDGLAKNDTFNGKGGGLIAYSPGKTFWPHNSPIGYTLTINNCKFINNKALEGGNLCFR